jgi:hypothetical protein
MLDLTDGERDALIRFLRDGIDRDRLKLAPRLAPIRAILDKLQLPRRHNRSFGGSGLDVTESFPGELRERRLPSHRA